MEENELKIKDILRNINDFQETQRIVFTEIVELREAQKIAEKEIAELKKAKISKTSEFV